MEGFTVREREAVSRRDHTTEARSAVAANVVSRPQPFATTA